MYIAHACSISNFFYSREDNKENENRFVNMHSHDSLHFINVD